MYIKLSTFLVHYLRFFDYEHLCNPKSINFERLQTVVEEAPETQMSANTHKTHLPSRNVQPLPTKTGYLVRLPGCAQFIE
jgi:hypothetical protein